MNFFLLQKQEPIFKNTKSLNQYHNIEAQTSDEIQPSKTYENSIVVFDDMLLSKRESKFILLFTGERHSNNDIYYIIQSYFRFAKITIRNNSNRIIPFSQTLRDIILRFQDIAGLGMNLEEWKKLSRKARETEYEYLQVDRFAKIGEGRYTIKNCNENTYIE